MKSNSILSALTLLILLFLGSPCIILAQPVAPNLDVTPTKENSINKTSQYPQIFKTSSGQSESTPISTSPSKSSSSDPLLNTDLDTYYKSTFKNATWDEMVESGMKAYHSNDTETAYTSLFHAVNKGCESPLVLFMLGTASEARGNFYSAVDYYQMAKRQFNLSHSIHRFAKMVNESLARALIQSGNELEGYQLLEQSTKHNPSFWSLKMLGLNASAKNDIPSALSYFERALRATDSDTSVSEILELYLIQGRLFLKNNESEGATRSYQKALEIDPQNQEALMILSRSNKSQDSSQLLQMIEKMSL